MSVETPEELGSTEADSVRRWFTELDLADKHEKKWRERGRKVVERYRFEQEAEGSQFNILWANVETLRPNLYSSTPKPDVQRRYKDADPAGAIAAKILERALSFAVDDQDYDSVAGQVMMDYLLPGRGIARVRYKPTMGQEVTPDGSTLEVVVYEEAPIEYVNWERFRMSPAECWEEVRWVAFMSYMTRAELVRAFGKVGGEVPLTIDGEGKRVENDSKREEGEDFYLRAEVWEVWDKEERHVCIVARGLEKYLLETDDPLQLRDFFPCPRPLYAVKTNGTMIPVPEFCLYQDQADELNTITARITRLVDAIKVRGFYNSQHKEAMQEALDSDENILIPIDNWTDFAEKGGADGAISWVPIEQMGKTLVHLYQKRSEIIQTIYELTGLSDIQRGASDPRETKGAQQLKAQFGTQRLAPRQREVAAFFRDLMRLQAEIIAEHFSPQTLALMTGLADDPQVAQAFEQAVAVLQSDTLRAFKIDVETDSTVLPDQMAEKQAVTEFLGACQAFVAGFGPMVQEGVIPLPVMKSLLLAASRRSKFGREVEASLMQMPDQMPQKPDPAQAKAQAEMQQAQAEMQMQQQQNAVELQFKQAELELKKQELQLKIQAQAAELQMKEREMQMEMELKRQQTVGDLVLKSHETEQRSALDQQKVASDMALKEREAAHSATLERERAVADVAVKREESQAKVAVDREHKSKELDHKKAMGEKELAVKSALHKEKASLEADIDKATNAQLLGALKEIVKEFNAKKEQKRKPVRITKDGDGYKIEEAA